MLRRLSFDLWYRFGRPPWDTGVSPPELFAYLAAHPAGRALDIGCGTGTNLLTLARHGWAVLGVDFAPRALQLARRKLSAAGVQADLKLSDATQLDGIHGPFDLAFDLGCFHGLPAKSDYLRQLRRVLRVGGHWLMYGFFKESATQAGPGLLESDLQTVQSAGMKQLSRQDGSDVRGRASAWFLYERRAGS
jgi:ubiquinone/menaquinone biosynthesis C-methylase UbiE